MDRASRGYARLGFAAGRTRDVRTRGAARIIERQKFQRESGTRVRGRAGRRRQRLELVVRARAWLSQRPGIRRAVPQAPHRNLHGARRARAGRAGSPNQEGAGAWTARTGRDLSASGCGWAGIELLPMVRFGTLHHSPAGRDDDWAWRGVGRVAVLIQRHTLLSAD